MPPKSAKGKGEKNAKKKIITPLEDIDTTFLTRTQLEEFCVNVHDALTKEKQHSDFLRLERDKLVNMVAIAQDQLIQAKHENYKKQMELDDAEEKHRLEMKQKTTQLMHLKCEKNTDYLNTQLASFTTRGLERMAHESKLDEIRKDIEDVKSKYVVIELKTNETKVIQDIEYAEKRHTLREIEKETSILIEHKWEKKLNNKISFLNDVFKQEYEQLESRKIKESSQVIKFNDRFTTDLNHYYNKIVYHNLNLMMKLKENLHELKSEIVAVEKNLSLLRFDNNQLNESLHDSKIDIQRLQEQLAHSESDRKELQKTRKELQRKNASLEYLKIESQTLNMALDKQDELIDQFSKEKEEKLFMLQIMAEDIVLVLEYMAVHLHHKLDEINSILSKLAGSNTNLPSHQMTKDHLTWDLGTVADSHDQILDNYKRLLEKYGVHPDNTGFSPLLAEEILKRVDYLRILVIEEIV